MTPSFEYVFPAIRGIQARREFYVSMVPLRLLPKVFSFNEDAEMPPELRHQRALNKARIPAMARYLVERRDDYIFSAITASIDASVRFEAFSDGSDGVQRMGLLHVPMDGRFIINDGQHRRAAIAEALNEAPELADEAIAVVFFLDTGLERCQQMFADLNGHAVRTSRAINILFDHSDRTGKIAKHIAFNCPAFKNLVEMDRSTLAARSRKLFTLSAIYSATKDLLADQKGGKLDDAKSLASRFWENVSSQFPSWRHVAEDTISAGEVRQDFIFVHGIGLHALGRVGRTLLKSHPDTWQRHLTKLQKVDWGRRNPQWEGRAMTAGRLSKSDTNVTLTANLIKQTLNLPLSPEEQRIEDNFRRGSL